MTITKDIPFADYLARQSVHFSALKAMEDSPAAYLRALRGRADTDALRVGRAVDSLILGGEAGNVVTYDGGARRGTTWTEFEAAHAGATILTCAQRASAIAMRDAVLTNTTARDLFIDGAAQVTVEWEQDVNVGSEMRDDAREVTLPCRARVDYLRDNGEMVELKTCRATTRSAIQREVARFYYHAQIAFYVDGLVANGQPPPRVLLVVVTKIAPHEVIVFNVRDAQLEIGRRKVDTWMRAVAECAASGRWPGLGDDGPVDLELPAWCESDGLDDADMSGAESAEEV